MDRWNRNTRDAFFTRHADAYIAAGHTAHKRDGETLQIELVAEQFLRAHHNGEAVVSGLRNSSRPNTQASLDHTECLATLSQLTSELTRCGQQGLGGSSRGRTTSRTECGAPRCAYPVQATLQSHRMFVRNMQNSRECLGTSTRPTTRAHFMQQLHVDATQPFAVQAMRHSNHCMPWAHAL
jgi:hypothetical protein